MSESEVSVFDDLLKALRVAKWARYAIILLCLCGAGLGGIVWHQVSRLSDEHNDARYYSVKDHVADEANRNERISAAVKLNDEKFESLGRKIEDVNLAQQKALNEQKEMHGQFTEVRDAVRSINIMLLNKSVSTKAPEHNPFDANPPPKDPNN